MPTPLLVAVVGVAGALLGAFINNYFSSRNSRRDREQRELQAERDRLHREHQSRDERQHREQQSRREQWLRQKDVAIEQAQSDDAVLRSIGFMSLTYLKDDPVATAEDRDLIQKIGDRSVEGSFGKLYLQMAESTRRQAEEFVNPFKTAPPSNNPIEAFAMERMSQHMEEYRKGLAAGAQWMKLEGIQLYGGLPPETTR
ncbi:hypothetical protein P5V93_13585 [Mycobacteroides abscessus subsp. abscessus]|uniref:hypothetical protein n=1 Tax=Mycobacteroides abscessus TaxID=36809 RepID=UPI000941A542|nr:hypothetical protein [Mycobacteroides abscessus]AWG52018.1 hypothetical protein DDT48_23300 [Mycobacteroides abscessus]MBN7550960.1 hypothetical protein [Mycobacteroides abscessus subsp. abscessus]MDM2421485.1 hypothetical protein [Mycobacteroides abscessus]MDM2427858.1 hypothetical protein [Mycobacteroides abscessus]MDM2432920.1 hypothetical protein [Mycobacteroides abscessus]